ncbi:MAG: restriction endonuclease subunit S [Rhodoferax sp.]|uniref:restriction endonuclease subunit S n=1 Tax=Rhodoferax sp. TaxID=50421 RepID=UPI003263A48B
MSFPRYPTYKDSGVEWLGEVPGHWEVVPLKHLANFINGDAFKPTEWADSGTPIIRIQNLNGSDNFNYYDGEVESRYLVNDGDLLFGWSGNRGTSFGPFLWRHPEVCALNQHIFRVVPYHAEKRSLYWTLKAVTAHVEDQAHGIIGMVHVTKGDLGAICVPTPPVSEQTQIATFLDRETAKIDGLVAEQLRLMALLKEKRQAVITHAVTQGLNPDAPMKPSGVEWLGEVPAHWDVIALKRIADVQTGVAKGKDHGSRTTISVPYLRVANVQDGYLNLETVATMDIPPEDLQRYALQPGDVLMNEGGDFDKLGRGHVWEGQIEPCITQNHVFAVRPRKVASAWLNAVTGSNFAQFYFMTRSKQSTNLASISSTNLMELPVILPPENEQVEILAFIANQSARFDTLTAEAQRAIALLQERHTALVSAAVTGQIDVRGLAAIATH